MAFPNHGILASSIKASPSGISCCRARSRGYGRLKRPRRSVIQFLNLVGDIVELVIRSVWRTRLSSAMTGKRRSRGNARCCARISSRDSVAERSIFPWGPVQPSLMWSAIEGGDSGFPSTTSRPVRPNQTWNRMSMRRRESSCTVPRGTLRRRIASKIFSRAISAHSTESRTQGISVAADERRSRFLRRQIKAQRISWRSKLVSQRGSKLGAKRISRGRKAATALDVRGRRARLVLRMVPDAAGMVSAFMPGCRSITVIPGAGHGFSRNVPAR